MITEYKYRPPLKYLLIGLGGLAVASIFGLAMVSGSEVWFFIIVGIFCLASLAVGICFLIIFLRKFNSERLKLGNYFIEIPRRWRDNVRLKFSEILEVSEFETYDNVIEVKSKQGVHLIERNWMKQKEFDDVKVKLKEYWQGK